MQSLKAATWRPPRPWSRDGQSTEDHMEALGRVGVRGESSGEKEW